MELCVFPFWIIYFSFFFLWLLQVQSQLLIGGNHLTLRELAERAALAPFANTFSRR